MNSAPYWVTRNRRDDAPQLPHPDAVDEYVDGKATGRMQIIRGSAKFVGTLKEVDEWLKGLNMSVAAQAREMRRKINNGTIHQPYSAREAQAIRYSGLKRNLREEDRLRACLEKFHQGSRLNDRELRFLLQYYGMLIRLCEVSGMRYHLMSEEARTQHNKLLDMAKERDWTQSLISMYGGMVEGILERIF